MNIFIINNQKDLFIDNKLIENQVLFILKKEKIKFNELYLNFVDKKKISSIHKKYFNDSSPTDCISFPIDNLHSNITPIILGEIFICPKIAIEYGEKHKIPPKEELTLYIVHGLLHLLGYDDISKKDKIIMKKKEKQCMKLLKEQGLI